MASGKCFSCGAELVPGKRFCFKCGTELITIQNSKSSCICGAVLVPNKKYCFKCGRDVKKSENKAYDILPFQSKFAGIKENFDKPILQDINEKPEKSLPQKGINEKRATMEDTILSDDEDFYDDRLEERNPKFLPPIEPADTFNSGYELIVISGIEKGRIIDLNRVLLPVGKLTPERKHGWILFDSSSIAIEQAVIKWNSEIRKFSIMHRKNSHTATVVNNKEIPGDKFTTIYEGDFIQIGSVRLEVRKNSKKQGNLPDKEDYFGVPHVFGGKKSDSDGDDPYVKKGLIRVSSKDNLLPDTKKPDDDESYDDEDRTIMKSKKVTILAELHAIEGADKGSIFPLTKDVTLIGRRSKRGSHLKDIELSELDKSISRSHARIEKKGGEFYLIKEKEENIMYLNSSEVEFNDQIRLVNGDKIKMGDETVLLFKRS
jgi:hypothetical protein